MFRLIAVSGLMLMASAANADPFAAGDPAMGKTLVEKNCIACHASKFGGDGSAIYTREDRKIHTSKGLQAQIRSCNTMLGLTWFEDEELHVANYLNKTYYKFEK